MFDTTTYQVMMTVKDRASENLSSTGYLGNSIAQDVYQIHLGVTFSHPSDLVQSTEHSLAIREIFLLFDKMFIDLKKESQKRISAAIKREISTIDMKVNALREKFKDNIDCGVALIGGAKGCAAGLTFGAFITCALIEAAPVVAPLVCLTGAPIAGAIMGSKERVGDYKAEELRSQVEARLDHAQLNKEVYAVTRAYLDFLMDRLFDIQQSLQQHQTKLESRSITIPAYEKEAAPLKELSSKYREFYITLKSWTPTCDQIKIIAGRIWHQHIREEHWGLYDPLEARSS